MRAKSWLYFNTQFTLAKHCIHIERGRDGWDIEIVFRGRYLKYWPIYRLRPLMEKVVAGMAQDIADEVDAETLRDLEAEIHRWHSAPVDIEPTAEPQKIVCTWSDDEGAWSAEARVVSPTTLELGEKAAVFPCR